MLLKMLRLRFGELPAAVVARVEAAEVPELEAWTDLGCVDIAPPGARKPEASPRHRGRAWR